MSELPTPYKLSLKQPHTKTMPYRQNIISKYLLIWAGLSIFIAIILNLLYSSDYDIELASIQLSERNLVKQTRHDIEYEFSRVLSDMNYLASQSPIGDFLDHPGAKSLQRMNEAFVLELRARSNHYRQIRFIGLDGWEVARVNSMDGQTYVVPYDGLQEVGRRFYFQKSLELTNARQIYISPIDLNVERGEIVMPYQPMIRFAMKIFRNNVARGILVINYDAQHVLDALVRNDHALWLVDGKGFWLAGPDDEVEWGFMFPDKAGTRFQDRYPDVWQQAVVGEKVSQQRYAEGLFTHASIVLDALQGEDMADRAVTDLHALHVVSHIAQARLDKVFAGLTGRYVILFLAAVMITGVSLYLLYRSSRVNAKSVYEARHNRLRFEQLVEYLPDAMVICQPDGRIAMVNKQAEQLFQYSRKELLGKPVATLIPEKNRANHNEHIKTYVAAPTVRPMGSRDRVLYGLRKDGSEFPVSISLSPIDSGEDMLVASAIRDITHDRRSLDKHS
jgi:PAS domain S-box-containing protein